MKEIFEMLWDGFYAEKCSMIEDEQERTLMREADEIHKDLNELLTDEQIIAIEKYIEMLYRIQDLCVKKAFLKGCEFVLDIFL